MSSLDDIIGECQKIAEIERVKSVETEIMCLIVKVKHPMLDWQQVNLIANTMKAEFISSGEKPPPIIVINDRFEITAIPKSMLKDDA